MFDDVYFLTSYTFILCLNVVSKMYYIVFKHFLYRVQIYNINEYTQNYSIKSLPNVIFIPSHLKPRQIYFGIVKLFKYSRLHSTLHLSDISICTSPQIINVVCVIYNFTLCHPMVSIYL